jgi:alpha-L-arabinofuranosidase
MKRFALTLGMSLCAMATLNAVSGTITIDASKPGLNISPLLYGIFFEEINRAGDGGIYAEMVQNRSFEDAAIPLAWTPVKDGGAELTMALDQSQPLHANNQTSLRLEIAKSGKRAGVANFGFKGAPYGQDTNVSKWLPKFEEGVQNTATGIAVQQGAAYLGSLYARGGHGFAGTLTVSLEKPDGTVLASQTINGIGDAWKKFECRLTSTATDNNARLVVATTSTGTLWLDMVSLFPKDTWKGHGMRSDLMQMLANMKPAFVRFPGGCWVEGDVMKNAYRWKETIGDMATRRSLWNRWGYCSMHGLGFHEYFQLCEDLGAEPLFVINCGMAHKDNIPMDQMQEFVQDALDAIEYANGPVDSPWGKRRAEAGHPAPFNLKYMEIGNENGGPAYVERYALFHDAIKKRYPEMHLIVDYRPTGTRPPEIVDEHYYNNPEFFMRNADKYDKYDRSAHKVYVGEYAVTRGSGRGNLIAALGEAAFMTGMERNGDVVVMASYAPLFERLGWKGWNPNAILFDAAKCYGTPAYHVQALFGNHRADLVLPMEVDSPLMDAPTTGGLVGVGTWNTQAEFKDLKVVQDGKVLFESDFSKNAKSMKLKGDWTVQDGALRYSREGTEARATVGKTEWKDYTFTLKARKLSGKEGFLVMIRAQNEREKSWWNIGGWGNKQHGLEMPGIVTERVPGHIETNRWYDIKIELKDHLTRCFLDGKLIHEVTTKHQIKALYATSGFTRDGRELIVKVVNTGAQALTAPVEVRGLKGVEKTARGWVLTSGNPQDENTLEEPNKISAREFKLDNAGVSFTHAFPAYSATVLRLRLN